MKHNNVAWSPVISTKRLLLLLCCVFVCVLLTRCWLAVVCSVCSVRVWTRYLLVYTYVNWYTLQACCSLLACMYLCVCDVLLLLLSSTGDESLKKAGTIAASRAQNVKGQREHARWRRPTEFLRHHRSRCKMDGVCMYLYTHACTYVHTYVRV